MEAVCCMLEMKIRFRYSRGLGQFSGLMMVEDTDNVSDLFSLLI